jgi:predicted ArsR family transcriptional regulator
LTAADPSAKPVPQVLQGVVVRRTFGELRVVKTGLRTRPTKSHPDGEPAAECVCSCGRPGVIVANHKLLGGQKTCGHGRASLPRRTPNPDRARILAYLDGHGPSRLTVLAAALGMTAGAAGGQLYLMAKAGQVVRRERGVWRLPGQDGPPPPEPGDRSAAGRKAARTRWAGMDDATRADLIARQEAGRAATRRDRSPERAGLVAFLEEAGGTAWFAELAAASGDRSVAADLAWLVRRGQLTRPFPAFYALPGVQVPGEAELAATAKQRRAEASRRGNRTRWDGMDAAARAASTAGLAAGALAAAKARSAAARARHGSAYRPRPGHPAG